METPLYSRLMDLAHAIGAYRGYWTSAGIRQGDQDFMIEIKKNYTDWEVRQAKQMADFQHFLMKSE